MATAKQIATDKAIALGIKLEGTETEKVINQMIVDHEAANKTPNEITVDQDYLDAHPELADKGIEVGDIITEDDEPTPPNPAAAAPVAKPAVKGKGAMAVLKGNEYVRTYPADQMDELNEFLGKKGDSHTAVPDESIAEIEVPYTVKNKETGAVEHTSKTFTDKADAILFKNEQRSVCLVKGK